MTVEQLLPKARSSWMPVQTIVVPFYWYANSILLRSQAVTSLPTVAAVFFSCKIFFLGYQGGFRSPPLDTALLVLCRSSLCRWSGPFESFCLERDKFCLSQPTETGWLLSLFISILALLSFAFYSHNPLPLRVRLTPVTFLNFFFYQTIQRQGGRTCSGGLTRVNFDPLVSGHSPGGATDVAWSAPVRSRTRWVKLVAVTFFEFGHFCSWQGLLFFLNFVTWFTRLRYRPCFVPPMSGSYDVGQSTCSSDLRSRLSFFNHQLVPLRFLLVGFTCDSHQVSLIIGPVRSSQWEGTGIYVIVRLTRDTVSNAERRELNCHKPLPRTTGIEPGSAAWQARALPLALLRPSFVPPDTGSWDLGGLDYYRGHTRCLGSDHFIFWGGGWKTLFQQIIFFSTPFQASLFFPQRIESKKLATERADTLAFAR